MPSAPAERARTGISGSLEDVSVADVMQFIHLGRRTGTLVLAHGGEAAMIGFSAGKLVSARAPGQPKLGDLLVEHGLVERELLENTIADETQGDGRRTLGQILVAEGAVRPEDLRRVVVHQIERAIAQVVRWTSGSFEFRLDDLRPVDDIALYPSDVVPDADLNTQMVLLEAARIFDEQRSGRPGLPSRPDRRSRPEAPSRPGPASPPAAATAAAAQGESLRGLAQETMPELVGGTADAPELQVVSDDEALLTALGVQVAGAVSRVRRCSLGRAGAQEPGRPAPIVLVDLRDAGRSPADLATLRRARPRASVVALVEPGPQIAAAYEAGAVAALLADAHAVSVCVDNIVESRRELAQVAEASPAGAGRREQGVARLRRVFGDLRSGFLSATVALNLMHIMSESVERAILFLVKRDALVALGAFGSGADGRPLAELTRGARIALGESNALTAALAGGEARTVDFAESALPERLAAQLDRPANGLAVVFPVLGAQRVIAVIYADNGERPEEIEDVEILELATAQVGMAFENELLRRQIGRDG